jgi:hypothetical protein
VVVASGLQYPLLFHENFVQFSLHLLLTQLYLQIGVLVLLSLLESR